MLTAIRMLLTDRDGELRITSHEAFVLGGWVLALAALAAVCYIAQH